MATKARKRKGKIRIKQKVLIEKKDKTNVVRPDTTRYRRMDTQMPRSNGMVLKVKLKKKPRQ